MQGDRHGPMFILMHADIQFSQNYFLKMLSFLQLVFSAVLPNIKCLKVHGLKFWSLILFCWSLRVCVFLSVVHCFSIIIALQYILSSGNPSSNSLYV